MTATELRIGNYVFDKHNELHEIGVNDFYSMLELQMGGGNASLLKPIPFNEEWALKLGLEQQIIDGYKVNLWNLPKENSYQGHHLMQMSNAWTWFIDFEEKSDSLYLITGFNFVHELQNLCFVLTNQELTIKEL